MLRLQEEAYGDHLIAAAPGTHLAAAQALVRYCDTKEPVLDFGCFSGAMIERLRAAGYAQVWGTDLAPHFDERLRFNFVQADLNVPFAHKFDPQTFGGVIVSEVIEHLDDPRAFLRELRSLIRPNGVAVVTTPNIAFFEGRIKFILRGELWGFGANNYLCQRHISPISREQAPLLLKECGYELLEMFTAASFATWLRKVLTLPLWLPMRALLGPSVLGESLILVARRSEIVADGISSQATWGAGR